MTDKDKELEMNIRFLAKCCKEEYNDVKVDAVLLGTLELINRQQAEIERLKIENQSLRSAANSYKLHYNKAVNDFEKFTQRAYLENPFACEICAHSTENGRACLWKREHNEVCLGRQFKYGCSESKTNQFREVTNLITVKELKDFAESVKMAFYHEFDELISSIMADKIDELVKEMVGDTE